MTKQLKEIDSLYENIIAALPHKERLVYCEQLIDKTQLSLIRNRKLISKTLEEKLKTIIEAAQAEIRQIKSIANREP